MKVKELEKIAADNVWNCDRHTLLMLKGLLLEELTPGEKYALRRAIRIIKDTSR